MSQRSSVRSVCLAVMVAVCAALPAQADAPLGHYTASMEMVTDNKTGLTWQQTHPWTGYNWWNAKNYCANLDLNGAGWRLPTVKELLTLDDISKENPSIDTSVNGFPGTINGPFWSATPYAMAWSYAWYVDFYNSQMYYDVVVTEKGVRCVR